MKTAKELLNRMNKRPRLIPKSIQDINAIKLPEDPHPKQYLSIAKVKTDIKLENIDVQTKYKHRALATIVNRFQGLNVLARAESRADSLRLKRLKNPSFELEQNITALEMKQPDAMGKLVVDMVSTFMDSQRIEIIKDETQLLMYCGKSKPIWVKLDITDIETMFKKLKGNTDITTSVTNLTNLWYEQI